MSVTPLVKRRQLAEELGIYKSMTIRLTSDEVNLLIYHYFRETGLNHSAFILQNEGRVRRTEVPRGKLLDILYKALVIEEIQAHAQTPEQPAACLAPFTLVGHSCRSAPPVPQADQNGHVSDCVVVSAHPSEVTAVSFAGGHLLTA